MSMYGRDPWGGPLEIHAADSATDEDRSRNLEFDKAALSRPLDETQQADGRRRAAAVEVCGPGLHHRQLLDLPVDGGDCPRRWVLSCVHHSHCQDGPAPSPPAYALGQLHGRSAQGPPVHKSSAIWKASKA